MIRGKISPYLLDPPHSIARPNQVIDLANEFVENGWDKTKPKLIAYPFKNRLQLLSGTHRLAASKLAGLDLIPVIIVSYDIVDKVWGTEKWKELMKLGELNEK